MWPASLLAEGAAREPRSATRTASSVTADDVEALAGWDPAAAPRRARSSFAPARVLMQDFTGVPAVVDLAAMRDAMADLGGDPGRGRPPRPGRAGHRPLDLGRPLRPAPTPSTATPSSSSSATASATSSCAGASRRSTTLRVVPPNTGICHQVNLEYLARVVFARRRRAPSPTRSSAPTPTPRWSTASACSAGASAASRPRRPCSASPSRMLAARGRRLPALRRAARGLDRHRPRAHRHRAAAPATAWSASSSSSTGRAWPRCRVENRATIGNMSPEYGSTMHHLPDRRRDAPLPAVHRPPRRAGRPGRGLRQGAGPLARPAATTPVFSEALELDLGDRRAQPRRPGPPAGPRAARPTPRTLRDAWRRCRRAPATVTSRRAQRRPGRGVGRLVPGQRPARRRRGHGRPAPDRRRPAPGAVRRRRPTGRRRSARSRLADGTETSTSTTAHVVIAAITSCTNTSNPSVMVAAGLLARKAVERGLDRPARGSRPRSPPAPRSSSTTTSGPGSRPPREARLQPGRLRLHDLHRQLGPAAAGDLRGGHRRRPVRVVGAVGQPQLRGPHQPRRAA